MTGQTTYDGTFTPRMRRSLRNRGCMTPTALRIVCTDFHYTPMRKLFIVK